MCGPSIHLSQAILLVAESDTSPIAFVLVMSKVTGKLRGALRIFAQKFEAAFCQFYGAPEDTASFNAAKSLVDECFKL